MTLDHRSSETEHTDKTTGGASLKLKHVTEIFHLEEADYLLQKPPGLQLVKDKDCEETQKTHELINQNRQQLELEHDRTVSCCNTFDSSWRSLSSSCQ